MTTATLTRTAECPSQSHITITVTGDISHVYRTDVADLIAPLSEHEKDIFIKCLIRFAKITRTAAQVRTALGNGVTVTI